MRLNPPERSLLRLALLWAVLGALATAAVLPYTLALYPARAAQLPPLGILVLASVAQSFVLLLGLSWLGLRLGRPLGLDSPLVRAWLERQPPSQPPSTLVRAGVAGLLIGGGLLLLDRLFAPLLPPLAGLTLPTVALWKRLLASGYGGITEELLLRLFLMTLLAWLLRRSFVRRQGLTPPWVFWAAILLAALLFGAAHLPAASTLWPLTAGVVVRTLALNALAGVGFGYLYWKRGLEHAMLAHFCADLVLHGVGGS